MTDQEPESDYTNVSVPDDDLPEDLQPGEENPLAEPAPDDADRQDMGDPHIEGLERDSDDRLTLHEGDEGDEGDDDGEG
jgi:hypothetical protein